MRRINAANISVPVRVAERVLGELGLEAETAVRHVVTPGSRPDTISTPILERRPACTGRASKEPATSTKITSSPSSMLMTAVGGTTTAASVTDVVTTADTKHPGCQIPPVLGATILAVAVRVASPTIGCTKSISNSSSSPCSVATRAICPFLMLRCRAGRPKDRSTRSGGRPR